MNKISNQLCKTMDSLQSDLNQQAQLYKSVVRSRKQMETNSLNISPSFEPSTLSDLGIRDEVKRALDTYGIITKAKVVAADRAKEKGSGYISGRISENNFDFYGSIELVNISIETNFEGSVETIIEDSGKEFYQFSIVVTVNFSGMIPYGLDVSDPLHRFARKIITESWAEKVEGTANKNGLII